MPLIESRDLMFGRRGLCAKVFSVLAMKALSLDKVNRLYDSLGGEDDFCRRALDALDADYEVSERDAANIPTEGPLVIISNHPTGGLDGIVLLDLISKIRPDVKTLGNFLVNRVEPMRRFVISVNPFDNRNGGNAGGLKAALRHVSEGGALLLFPAGEVDTWQRGFCDIKDRQWDDAAVKFIRHTEAPVLPIYIHARNSTLFRLAGKLSPKLRTAMLPREVLNKRGTRVRVSVGTAISAQRLSELGDRTTYGDYLRAMVDYMAERDATANAGQSCGEVDLSGIVERPAKEKLRNDLDAITEYRLFTHGNFSVYCAPPEKMPAIMIEIGRMREVTFRQVGEGTHKGVDTDRYDGYYRQLFVWDEDSDELVGAYRLGFGDAILSSYGLAGFYTDSLFHYSEQMKSILGRTIELGRSFVVKKYQKRPTSLMLLWKGIVYVLLKNEHYRYLVGPVTISGEFSSASKMLLVNYLRRHHYDASLAAQVKPLTGLDGVKSDIDPMLVDRVENVELINKIVSDLEHGERVIPVLVKKYLQLNSHVIGFNVDHDFCDGLDALMLLNLRQVPESTIAMLSKEITELDVLGRFKEIN